MSYLLHYNNCSLVYTTFEPLHLSPFNPIACLDKKNLPHIKLFASFGKCIFAIFSKTIYRAGYKKNGTKVGSPTCVSLSCLNPVCNLYKTSRSYAIPVLVSRMKYKSKLKLAVKVCKVKRNGIQIELNISDSSEVPIWNLLLYKMILYKMCLFSQPSRISLCLFTTCTQMWRVHLHGDVKLRPFHGQLTPGTR